MGTVVVIGQWRWGKGESLGEAKRNFQKQGAKLSAGYTVLTFDQETSFEGVDQMGRVHWRGNEPKVEEVSPRKLAAVRR